MSPGAEPPAKLYPNAGQAVLLVLVALGLQVATGATAFTIAYAELGDVPAAINMGMNVWVLIPAISISNALTVALALRATRERSLQFLRLRPFAPALLPAVVLTAVGLAIVLSETDNCFVWLIKLVTGSDMPPPDLIDLSTFPVGAAILLILVAPLSEEYLFRGLILRGFLTRYRWFAAVAMSAVAFAVVHVNLRQGFLALIIGLVFGWWYARTQSVGPGMIGHAIFNGIAWGAAQMPEVTKAFGLNNGQGTNLHVPWWLMLGGLALVALGIWSFHRDARVIGTDPSPPPSAVIEPPLLAEPPLLGPN
jgi:membrane protease YdiL (CAAX protease family)